jgi:hypothetical protein
MNAVSSLSVLTLAHVFVSLAAIAAGFVVVFGMIAALDHPPINALFLTLTTLTSLTGFLFPFKGITPGIVLGILSLIVLALAAIARYHGHLGKGWRGTYVISALLALYFNFFVFVVQMFEKVSMLRAVAPTQTELPFTIIQSIAFIAFAVLAILAFRRFHVRHAIGY